MAGADERGGRRRGGQGGAGVVMQGLGGLQENLGFYPQGGGSLEGCGQRRCGA